MKKTQELGHVIITCTSFSFSFFISIIKYLKLHMLHFCVYPKTGNSCTLAL